jgi:hypothetical protein
VLSQGQKHKKTDGGKQVRMKLMSEVYTVQVCSLKTTTVRMGSMPKMSKVGTHCFCELSGKGPFCVTGARNDRLLFSVAVTLY